VKDKLKRRTYCSTSVGSRAFFKKINADIEAATKDSFQIAREISAAGKSFTEGEFVKKCLLIAASELCLDKKSVFENITSRHV
jgi:hypothetical protein